MLLGIDEAGRGCVLGSLVLCGCAVREERTAELSALGLADSKTLAPARRVHLAARIRVVADRLIVRRISPRQVDEAVRNSTLNVAEVAQMVKIIKLVDPRMVYVDALTSRPARFGRQLEALIRPCRAVVIAENKADTRYPIVQAAAIVAKVTRDAEIAKLKRRHGDLGSGYPSDPKTRAFLMKIPAAGRWPAYVRKSWRTLARLT